MIHPDDQALEGFRQGFSDARVLSTTHHDRSTTMTTAPEQAPQHDQAEDQVWGQGQTSGPSYPEQPSNPHNHRYTISVDGRGPMVVIRGNTAAEVNEAAQELVQAGAGAALAAMWAAFTNAPAPAPQQAPQGPMAPFQAQAQQQFNQQPAQQFPQQGGQAPAAWQNVGAPQQQGGFGGGGQQGPKPRPNWPQVYKITVPYQQKDQFKAFREQNQQMFKGKLQWISRGDYYVHGDVVQQFAHLNPVPA